MDLQRRSRRKKSFGMTGGRGKGTTKATQTERGQRFEEGKRQRDRRNGN
jgi:hypothetical protein